MIKSVLVLAALTGQAEAIKVNETGIFSKLIQEENAANALDNEVKDAKERKKQQLIDAEAEYQKNVNEEEAEDKIKAEKEAQLRKAAEQAAQKEAERLAQAKAHLISRQKLLSMKRSSLF